MRPKLKKPVSFGCFDHLTLAARARTCAEEVRLNRALARDVSFGAAPLTLGGSGLALQGKGPVVDWMVRMRRLPADRMLDALIASHQTSLTEAEVAALLANLVQFYRRRRMAQLWRELSSAPALRASGQVAKPAPEGAVLPGIPLTPVTCELERRITPLPLETGA